LGPDPWQTTISGSGFRISGFGVRISDFGVGFHQRVSGFGCRVPGSGFGDSGFGFRISGFGIRDLGFGFRDSDFGIRISDFGLGFHQRELCARSQPRSCEAGSYLRLIDFVYHSTLGVRVIEKKKKIRVGLSPARTICTFSTSFPRLERGKRF